MKVACLPWDARQRASAAGREPNKNTDGMAHPISGLSVLARWAHRFSVVVGMEVTHGLDNGTSLSRGGGLQLLLSSQHVTSGGQCSVPAGTGLLPETAATGCGRSVTPTPCPGETAGICFQWNRYYSGYGFAFLLLSYSSKTTTHRPTGGAASVVVPPRRF